MRQPTQESELQKADAAVHQGIPPSPAIAPSASTPAYAPPPKRLKPLKWLFWSVVFGATATVSATIGAALVLLTPLSPAIAPNSGQPVSFQELWRKSFGTRITRPINILVMGIDRVPEAEQDPSLIFSGRSDTMLLIHIDPTDNTASLMSIPRDTQVSIPGQGISKINHANILGGAELSAQVVSGTLNNVPIDRYVRVSTDALRELVDLLGGVEVFVPRRMVYEDNTQNLHIDLEEGWQTLNGDQAEQFARFRKDNLGDVGRVQRQQQLLQALRNRITNPAIIPKVPEIIELFQTYIDTNLTMDEMLALASFGLSLDQEEFRMVMLPGRFSTPGEYIASYWIMDPDGRDQVLHEYFGVQPPLGYTAQRDLNRLSIAIQNASTDPQLGQQAAQYLRDQGFENVYVIGDWPDTLEQTQIIVQGGGLEQASQVETLLGLGQVVAASTGDLESDLTIRIGADWQQLLGAQP